MLMSLTVTPASGAVLLPMSVRTFLTASAGVGCLRASSGVRVSMGLPPRLARASSTFCMCGSALGGFGALAAWTEVANSVAAAMAVMIGMDFMGFLNSGEMAAAYMARMAWLTTIICSQHLHC